MKKLTEDEIFDLQTGTNQRTMSEEERHFFDIAGYLVLEDLLTPLQVRHAQRDLESLASSAPGAVTLEKGDSEVELLNVIENGGTLEDAMAIPQVLRYLGELIWGDQYRLVTSRGTIRRPGSQRRLNQGGLADPRRYARYRGFREGEFRCLMVTCMIALSDTTQGNGTLCLIPASHKSNLPHPYAGSDLEEIPPLREVPLRAGSGILFCEGISHAMKSPRAGAQAWLSYQYGPSYMVSWPGCEPSSGLLTRTAQDAAKAHLLMPPYYHPPESQKKAKAY
jgi:ectoine hydroxylase-related dioxygenase (phytanoyl-CoA dioxygenase family)